MKYEDVPFSKEDVKIGKRSMANMFGVSIAGGRYLFRSNKTVMVLGSESASSEVYEPYQFSAGDSWSSLAYRFYGTEELWWIICKFNQMSDPFSMPAVGDVIRIPVRKVADAILSSVITSGRSET